MSSSNLYKNNKIIPSHVQHVRGISWKVPFPVQLALNPKATISSYYLLSTAQILPD